MGKIKETLRNTPLLSVWHFVKTKPPVKQMRSLAGKWRRYYTLKIKLPRIYRKYASQPVDEKKVVFFEVRLAELTNSLQTLHRTITEMGGYEVHTHFLRLSFASRRQYDKNCVEFVKDIATAKYIFADEASNVLSCVPMRPETIVTQTWHGCGAFKKFGFSTADLIFGLNREQQLKYPFYKNYTYVTLSSPEVAWAYEEAMNLSDRPEVLKATGISRTDVFFDPDFIAKAYEKLHQQMPESKGRKVILYAPTFRGRVAHGEAPDKLDIPMFQKALGELVRTKLNSIQRMEVTYGRIDRSEILATVLQSDIEKIKQTLESVDNHAFELAVDTILAAKKVYVIGIRSCAPLAKFLTFYLNLICEDVVEVDTNSSSEIFEQLIRIGEEDVIIGISFPRYSMRTLKALEFASNRKAKVITLTDSVNSPMNLYSSCNLIAKSDMASIVDSLVAPLSVINALVVALCMKKQDDVIETLETLEDIWDEYQVYSRDELEPVEDEVRIK